MCKANGRSCSSLRTRISGHDHDHVTEISFTAVVIRQRAMVHDLKQQVENLRMRFLDLIKQQYAVRLFGDGLCQQPTLVETDIARRRADESRYGMPLHVLGHIEAY